MQGLQEGCSQASASAPWRTPCRTGHHYLCLQRHRPRLCWSVHPEERAYQEACSHQGIRLPFYLFLHQIRPSGGHLRPDHLAGLRRFVSRRGCPHTTFSDNGSNFRGAMNSRRELSKFLRSSDTDSAIHQHLLRQHITWSNIPERAPHFGGLWESAVKSMKYHLKRVVGSQILTYEEMETVTCQVEACLNSRPIIARTSHNEDGIVTLTSGHFLLLKPPVAYPDTRIPPS